MKTKHSILSNRSALKGWRSSPNGNASAQLMARQHDAFDAGYLRDAVNLWEYLEQRDDLLRTVISKRKKAAARHGWTILTQPNLGPAEKAAAREHAAALEYFYTHLECEHAVDGAEQGGFNLLARQMMDAIGKRFAVHEIVWRAETASEWHAAAASGRVTHRRLVTASFRFVPLAFFENTTGQLRFLGAQSTTAGRDLAPGAWLITVGEGLMFASATAWFFKNLALDGWVRFCEHNSRPLLRGVTAASPDSAEWDTFAEALLEAPEGNPVVHGSTDGIHVLDVTGSGALPFPNLVERMDRMMAAIWRGADLSTLSRDRGYGASLQEKESCILEEDDANMLTEALNRCVDEWVIRHVFGEGIKPFARVQVLAAPRECTPDDLQVDEFLLKHGAPLSLESTMHRYGRTPARPGELLFGSGPKPSARPESPQPSASDRSHHRSAAEIQNSEGVGSPGRPAASLFRERLANHTPGTAAPDAAAAPFTVLQPDWVQLSPYGDFPHSRGLQRMDHTAAETMVATFNSFLARASRLFGGVPFYAGHPDMPGVSETADRKAYGWITALEAREDGLYGFAKWSDAGRELLRQAHYKYLSPYWEATEIGREAGRIIFRPVALISVGLTNQPNIPVRPLANELAASAPPRPIPEPDPAADLLDAAIVSGRITPAQEEHWREALQNDLAGGRTRLESLATGMHTATCTGDLGKRRGELLRFANRQDRIQEAVARRQQLGLSYDAAWESVKREHPAWFE